MTISVSNTIAYFASGLGLKESRGTIQMPLVAVHR